MAISLAVLLTMAFFVCVQDTVQAGEPRRPRRNNYSGSSGAELLDAINRDHGVPARRSSSGYYGHGPTGAIESAPYESRKWYRNEVGMIDAINRDHPPIYPRNR